MVSPTQACDVRERWIILKSHNQENRGPALSPQRCRRGHPDTITAT